MRIQQESPKTSGFPPVFTSFTISVLSPIAPIARTIMNFESVLNGANTDSSFYIKVEKKTEDGSVLSRFVAGNPEIKRKGVTNYSINRIFTTPDGKGVVFVVEKTVEDSTGVSVRYMVETAVVDK